MTTDDDTPLTPAQEPRSETPLTFGVTAQVAYEALEPLRRLCAEQLDAIAGEMGISPPSQDVRTFLARRARDPQFWRLLAALRDDETKGDTDGA